MAMVNECSVANCVHDRIRTALFGVILHVLFLRWVVSDCVALLSSRSVGYWQGSSVRST